jgi:Sulfotransferase family
MISHQLKCIFIHIPRTAGSSIENWLQGKDQWIVERETKHLTSLQAKHIYKDYWDDYYKFSIVRNPYTRVVSTLKHGSYYGVDVVEGAISLERYKKKFGFPLTIENDTRFSKWDDVYKMAHDNSNILTPRCVYGNILSEKIDKVYQFEDLENAVRDIAQKLGIPHPDFPRKETRDHINYSIEKAQEQPKTISIKNINEVYWADFDRFGYTRM